MEQKIIEIISEVYYDLGIDSYGRVDAETLADTVADRMHDDCPEYRNTPFKDRRALVMSICSEYCSAE